MKWFHTAASLPCEEGSAKAAQGLCSAPSPSQQGPTKVLHLQRCRGSVTHTPGSSCSVGHFWLPLSGWPRHLLRASRVPGAVALPAWFKYPLHFQPCISTCCALKEQHPAALPGEPSPALPSLQGALSCRPPEHSHPEGGGLLGKVQDTSASSGKQPGGSVGSSPQRVLWVPPSQLFAWAAAIPCFALF